MFIGISFHPISLSNGPQQRLAYMPYGATQANSGTLDVRHKYTGQELDAEIGLYFYNARYYDPVLGRFTQADTIVPNPANPQTLNRYTYVGNNPIIMVDRDGHFFFVAMIVGAVVGGISAGVQSDWDLQATLTGAFIGGVSGGVGAGVGNAVLGATGSAVLGGAAGGAAAGATSSALYGGDILQGALMGAIPGGISGYVGTYNFGNPYAEGLAQIGTGALVGGGVSELAGGSFREGATLGAISGAVAFAANRMAEAQRYSARIAEQTKGALAVAAEFGITEAAMQANPTREYTITNGGEAIFDEGIYKSFNSEIDYIRETGRCSDCSGDLRRFGNYHVLRHSGGKITIHYDRYNAVTSPTRHYWGDVLFNW